MTLIEKIKSRGYWRVVVRPSDFVENRVNFTELVPTAKKVTVSMRGWDFPHSGVNPPFLGKDYIEYGTDWEHEVESWRLYQSGQFVFYGGIIDDWKDQSSFIRRGPDWKVGQSLGFSETVIRFTEIFEFATRFATSPLSGNDVEVQIDLRGLNGRQLYNDNRGSIFMRGTYIASIDQFPQKLEIPKSELITNPRELAVKSSKELFYRFGMDPSDELLKDIQSRLRRQ